MNITKRFTLSAASVVLATSSASAGISLTSAASTYQQNFAGFGASSSASMPAGWVTTTTSFQGFTSNGTSVTIQNATNNGNITAGGFFGWGVSSGSPAVIGNSTLAWQGSSGVSASTVTVEFTNNSGTTITELSLSFDVYQWRQQSAGRATTVSLTQTGVSGLNAFTFTASNTGTAIAGRALGSAAPASFAADQSFAQTVSGLSIADGATFGFTFTFNRGTGTGSSQGIAIDNFSLSTVPAPGAMALLGVAGLLGTRRRR